ncbi:hypothetical protein LTR37_000244 [Vermiconidia calcicola]|uniref:Uncharacterized protein n=1 Tax=Vermiconidia calcicola TaxID=1690605 RepID=A0ACC3NZY1_9PEZI|nr:hypothetical protein LTR37_000244 [Vermiconidia calcicola]
MATADTAPILMGAIGYHLKKIAEKIFPTAYARCFGRLCPEVNTVLPRSSPEDVVDPVIRLIYYKSKSVPKTITAYRALTTTSTVTDVVRKTAGASADTAASTVTHARPQPIIRFAGPTTTTRVGHFLPVQDSLGALNDGSAIGASDTSLELWGVLLLVAAIVCAPALIYWLARLVIGSEHDADDQSVSQQQELRDALLRAKASETSAHEATERATASDAAAKDAEESATAAKSGEIQATQRAEASENSANEAKSSAKAAEDREKQVLQRVETSEQSAEQANRRADTFEASADKAIQRAEEAESSASEAISRAQAAENSARDSEQNAADYKEKWNSFEIRVTTAEGKNKTLESTNKESQKKIKDLERNQKIAAGKLASLEQRRDDLDTENKKLTTENDDLKSENEKAKGLQKRKEEVEVTANRLKGEVATLQTEKEEVANARAKDCQALRDELDRQRAAYLEEAANVNGANAELDRQHAELAKEHSALKKKHQEILQLLSTEQSRAAQLEASKDCVTYNAEQLAAEVQGLKAKFESVGEASDQERDEIVALRAQLEEYKARLAEAESQLEAAETALDDAEVVQEPRPKLPQPEAHVRLPPVPADVERNKRRGLKSKSAGGSGAEENSMAEDRDPSSIYLANPPPPPEYYWSHRRSPTIIVRVPSPPGTASSPIPNMARV